MNKNIQTMEFEGVVFRKLPEVTVSSARGAWKKQEVVFELPSEFSRKICVTFFGDRADDAASLQEGDNVTVSVNVESREYNGKWYTDVKAWKIVRNNGGGSGAHGGGAYGGSGGETRGASGAHGGGNANIGPGNPPPFAGAPFNESLAPTSAADDVDDLPF
jgi:single-stranded DNA-binding protein